jgi:hypothetical protein
MDMDPLLNVFWFVGFCSKRKNMRSKRKIFHSHLLYTHLLMFRIWLSDSVWLPNLVYQVRSASTSNSTNTSTIASISTSTSTSTSASTVVASLSGFLNMQYVYFDSVFTYIFPITTY